MTDGPLEHEHTAEAIAQWREGFVVATGKSQKTGRNYLDAISGVFAYEIAKARYRGDNPVDEFRRRILTRGRPKNARSRSSR